MSGASGLEAIVLNEYGTRLRSVPQFGAYVQVQGATSSGKTTALKSVAESSTSWNYVYDDSFLRNDRFKDYHYKLFIQRDLTYYLAFQIEALSVRFLQNQTAGSGSICDQSIHSIWAYSRALVEQGHISDSFYQTFYSSFLLLRSLFTWPAFVVHFTCRPEIAHARVLARGREHEIAAYTPDFLRHLSDAHLAVMDDFPPQVSTATIDTSDLSADETARALEELLHAHKNRQP